MSIVKTRPNKRADILRICILAMPIWASLGGYASATLVDVINALAPGDMYRVMFVSSTTRDATSTDIADYNSFIATAAGAGTVTGPLGLSWKALASTSFTNAQDNTGVFQADTTTVHFFNTNGDLLATSGSDLWDGMLTVPLGLDENGSDPGSPDFVWTGTDGFGNSFNVLGSQIVTAGHKSQSNSGWINGCGLTDNTQLLRLYGISNKVTVVPEPSTATLFALGLAFVASRQRRPRLLESRSS